MSAQFTPGPWRAYDYGDVWYVATPSLRIGSIDTNHEANANLIAAAPCMAAFVEKHALAGDPEAIKLWERINGTA